MIITVTFTAEASFTQTIDISDEEYSKLKEKECLTFENPLYKILTNGVEEFDFIEPNADIENIEFDENSIGQIKRVW
jgi:hypothetical protein